MVVIMTSYNYNNTLSEFPMLGNDTPMVLSASVIPTLTRHVAAKNMNRYIKQTPSLCVDTDSRKCRKTRLCNRWGTNNGCTFGAGCNYAHGVDDLNIVDCTYGAGCYKIKQGDDGGYINMTTMNPCCFKHPGEETKQFRERIRDTKATIFPTDFSTPNDRPIRLPTPMAPDRMDTRKDNWSDDVDDISHSLKRSFDDMNLSDQECITVPENKVVSVILKMVSEGVRDINIRVDYTPVDVPVDDPMKV